MEKVFFVLVRNRVKAGVAQLLVKTSIVGVWLKVA